MSESCPASEVLYALATDDEASPEVRQHVATCAACRQQIAEIGSQSTTMRQLVATSGPALPASADHPAAIGKYVIVGIISDDSEAVCYRGLHSVLHVEVSILVGKQFKAASPAEQEPLVYTARPLFGIELPGVAHVRDIGFLDGTPYLVHDYISGRRLDRLPADQPLPLSIVVRGGDAVLTALAELHRRGLPHGCLGMRSIVGTDGGELMIVDLGRAWLNPRQPIVSDTRQAADILHQLLAHVPPAERRGTYEGLVLLCRQALASPALAPPDFWQQWRKTGGLDPSAVWPIGIALIICGLIVVLVIVLILLSIP